MDLQADSKLLQDFDHNSLIDYLELTGWKLSSASNKKWRVFEGAQDYYGEPLEIVLPQNLTVSDANQYLANTINMLSALAEKDPEIITHNIKYYDRDILRIRNVETNESSSISLHLAAQQVPQLKNLVSFAACSEVDQIPFHVNANKPIAKQMVTHYQFGHTFKGSFGYTVESPVMENIGLAKGMFERETKYRPIERRVMERIVRGLSITINATESKDSQILIDGYGDGLNANMCRALIRMSLDSYSPIEYAITWSPKYPASEDIIGSKPYLLAQPEYNQLEYVANILEKLEPKEVTIRGFVKELKVNDNPLGTDTSRTVVLDVINASDNLPTRIIVSLNKEDYQQALIANGDWLPVNITGILQRRRGNWYMVKYSAFNVTPSLFKNN